MATVFQITAEGLFYSSRTRRIEVAEAIQLFSKLLKGRNKAATFNALNQGIFANWILKDDVVVPFGDKRSTLSITYTFDLDVDILRILEPNGGLELPLDSLRRQDITANDITVPFELPLVSTLNRQAFPRPHWTPDSPVSLRKVAFVTRILSDLNYGWRHVLRRPYNATILQKFLRAVTSIGTLDFNTIEESSRWLHTSQTGRSGSGPFIGIFDLPPWNSSEKSCIQFGRITIVVDGELEHAMTIARKAMRDHTQDSAKELNKIYLLFSGRYIMLCRSDSHGKIEHTAPAPLLNGIDAPPLSAVELLLQALAFAYSSPPPHRIERLPVELQDRILQYVSEGPIESARVGCLLEIGSPSTWVRMDKTRRRGDIEVYPSLTHRSPTTPIDSYIWVAGTFCGLAYR